MRRILSRWRPSILTFCMLLSLNSFAFARDSEPGFQLADPKIKSMVEADGGGMYGGGDVNSSSSEKWRIGTYLPIGAAAVVLGTIAFMIVKKRKLTN